IPTGDGGALDVTALRARVAREIGPSAEPRHVTAVPDVPRTRSGKIMRRLLAQLVHAERDRRRGVTPEPLGDVTSLQNPDAVDTVAAVLTALPAHDPAVGPLPPRPDPADPSPSPRPHPPHPGPPPPRGFPRPGLMHGPASVLHRGNGRGPPPATLPGPLARRTFPPSGPHARPSTRPPRGKRSRHATRPPPPAPRLPPPAARHPSRAARPTIRPATTHRPRRPLEEACPSPSPPRPSRHRCRSRTGCRTSPEASSSPRSSSAPTGSCPTTPALRRSRRTPASSTR